jgi:hypothetical protein
MSLQKQPLDPLAIARGTDTIVPALAAYDRLAASAPMPLTRPINQHMLALGCSKREAAEGAESRAHY